MKHPFIYYPLGGTRITTAIVEAIALAANFNRPVRFSFNGIRQTVNKRLSLRHVLSQWEEMCAASSTRYQKSARGRADKAQQEQVDIEHQSQARDLIRLLPWNLEQQSLNLLIDWLQRFTKWADHISVKFDAAALASALEAVGYRDSEGVGEAPEYFSTRERMGRYIVGQAINCLRSGMPPHPILGTFAERYFVLPPVELTTPQQSTEAEG